MPINQLTILAPGLIGGSVARAARARGVAERIVIWARRPETRLALAEQDWCDAVAETPEAAAIGAQLVVIASPVDNIVALARQIAPSLLPDAVVTDVGSVKHKICVEGHAALKGHGHFVGAHPMGGSEKTGWENATAELFHGRTCFVTPLNATDSRAQRIVASFWRDLGSDVVNVDPEIHDEIVAHISHLPQVLASALSAFLATRDISWRKFGGGGLRDTTRMAGSSPQLWHTILEQNHDEVLQALRGFQGELAQFEQAFARKDWNAVVAILQQGKDYRAGIR